MIYVSDRAKLDFHLSKLQILSTHPRFLEKNHDACRLCRKNLPHSRHNLLFWGALGAIPLGMLVFDRSLTVLHVAILLPIFIFGILLGNTWLLNHLEKRARRLMHAEIDEKKHQLERVTRTLYLAMDDLPDQLIGPNGPLSTSMAALDKFLQQAQAYQSEMRSGEYVSETMQETTSCMARLYGKRRFLKTHADHLSSVCQSYTQGALTLHEITCRHVRTMDLCEEIDILKDCTIFLENASLMVASAKTALEDSNIMNVLEEESGKTVPNLQSAETAVNNFISSLTKPDLVKPQ